MEAENINTQEHTAKEAGSENQDAYRQNGRMLRVSEAARLLGVHPNTIRIWTRSGVLRSCRVGPRRDRRIPMEVITAVLERS